jgi:ABC-type ATPase with predicted acetyltransferase domain
MLCVWRAVLPGERDSIQAGEGLSYYQVASRGNAMTGKIVYRSPSKQFHYCSVNEQFFYENCPACGQKLIICKVFGGQCNSGKCREERLKIERQNSQRNPHSLADVGVGNLGRHLPYGAK